MKIHVKRILISTLLYWLCMWVFIILFMLIAAGKDALLFEPAYRAIINYVLFTALLLPPVFLTWFIIIKKINTKKLQWLFWNLTMWIVITLICEVSFHVISGNVHSLNSFRQVWYLLLVLSFIITSLSYRYADKKISASYLFYEKQFHFPCQPFHIHLLDRVLCIWQHNKIRIF